MDVDCRRPAYFCETTSPKVKGTITTSGLKNEGFDLYETVAIIVVSTS
jgi:hypothetical protein